MIVPINATSELEHLLQLNILLSKVKDKKDLLEIINGHLKKFFSFNYSSAMKINADRETFEVFLLDPASMAYKHPNYKAITTSPMPMEDGIFNRVLDSGGPVIIDIETEYVKGPGNTPRYIMMHFESGIKELLAAPLVNEKEAFGMIVFYGDKKGKFKDIDKELISGIVGLVAIAASNVLANEEIASRDRERDILLSLSSKMAKIRDKEELLSLINTKMKELFYFTHCSISKVCEDRQTFTVFLTDPGSPSRGHQSFNKMIATRFPVDDGIFEHFLKTEFPIINSVEEVISRDKYPLYSQIHYQSGLREAVSIPLHDENDIWGVLHFYSDRVKTFAPEQFHTFTSVANQVAVAVLNIIANEDIRKREEEKSGLLMVAEEISKVRDKNDLLKFITGKLKPFLYFATGSVISFSEDHRSFQFYLTDSSLRSIMFRSGQSKLVHALPPVGEGIFNEMLRTGEPAVLSLKELETSGTLPEFVSALLESGQTEAVVAPLYRESLIWGALLLTAEVEGSFSRDYQRLLSSVASQVSVAVSNILANADISLRKQEKENLLKVSHELGTIRQFHDLLRLLNTRLKHLFYFSDCMVSVLQDEGESFKCYSFEHLELERAGTSEVAATVIPANELFFVKLIEGPAQVIIDAGNHIRQIAQLVGLSNGGVERISIRLYNEKGFFGVLSFLSDVKNCFNEENLSMVTGVGSQVAIALSNILAHDEVRQREMEKSHLLSFSLDIAAVRNKAGLAKVIRQYLEKLCGIRNYTISVINDDKQTHRYFIFDYSSKVEALPEFEVIRNTNFSVTGGLLETVLTANRPTYFDMKKMVEDGTIHYQTGKFWLDNGLTEMLGVPLRVGDNNIGVLWLDTAKQNNRLLMGFAAQVAVAVSNTIATEKVERQINEINNYKSRLEEENLYLQEEIVGSHSSDIIGNGQEMRKVYHLISQVAPTTSTVLVLGETGTGKELIARAIHNSSLRKEKLMVKVNCAALPANLIESELFGHEKGSFTGATERRIGKFELANKSTLFLDEVGELPLDLQAKLLRVLQEKEIERLGGRETLKVDVRIIAATNRNLQREVDAGRFRSDLFYRLNVVPVTLPALRERKEDIPVLVSHFIARFAKNAGKKISNISHKVLEHLMSYNWPGNVRELEHLIERSVLLTNGTTIREMHLPVKEKPERISQNVDEFRIKTINENERDHILMVLQRCGGKVSGPGGAAELLGVPHSTLTSKMSKLGIKKAHVFLDKDE